MKGIAYNTVMKMTVYGPKAFAGVGLINQAFGRYRCDNVTGSTSPIVVICNTN